MEAGRGQGAPALGAEEGSQWVHGQQWGSTEMVGAPAAHNHPCATHHHSTGLHIFVF